MKASIVVLAGALALCSWARAGAQPTDASAPVWTPVAGCPAANELGPEAYFDAENADPNAAPELQRLVAALKHCQTAAPQRSVAQAQSGEVIPDDGPTDTGAQNYPSASDASASDVALALRTTQQVVRQFRLAMAAQQNATVDGGQSADAAPQGATPAYAAAPSYAQPSYAQPAYAQPAPVYAVPAYARPVYYPVPVILYARPAYVRPAYAYPRAAFVRAQAARRAAARRWYR